MHGRMDGWIDKWTLHIRVRMRMNFTKLHIAKSNLITAVGLVALLGIVS